MSKNDSFMKKLVAEDIQQEKLDQALKSLADRDATIQGMNQLLGQIARALGLPPEDMTDVVGKILEIKRLLAYASLFMACPNEPCTCKRSRVARYIEEKLSGMGVSINSGHKARADITGDREIGCDKDAT